MIHEWKIGDWCEHRHASRYFVFDADVDCVKLVSRNGSVFCPSILDLTPLPDCTGWDWQPPIEPPEGYRLLKEGEVILVGDLWLSDRFGWETLTKASGSLSLDKAWSPEIHTPIARKIEPQYRPFANSEEFKPHRDRWLARTSSVGAWRLVGYSDLGIYPDVSLVTFETAFKCYTFEDGTPFGIATEKESTCAK